MGRFRRDLRTLNSQILSLSAFAHLATNFGDPSLHSKIPLLAAGAECENDDVRVLNQGFCAGNQDGDRRLCRA
jgi:hypothetical protein